MQRRGERIVGRGLGLDRGGSVRGVRPTASAAPGRSRRGRDRERQDVAGTAECLPIRRLPWSGRPRIGLCRPFRGMTAAVALHQAELGEALEGPGRQAERGERGDRTPRLQLLELGDAQGQLAATTLGEAQAGARHGAVLLRVVDERGVCKESDGKRRESQAPGGRSLARGAMSHDGESARSGADRLHWALILSAATDGPEIGKRSQRFRSDRGAEKGDRHPAHSRIARDPRGRPGP